MRDETASHSLTRRAVLGLAAAAPLALVPGVARAAGRPRLGDTPSLTIAPIAHATTSEGKPAVTFSLLIDEPSDDEVE